MPLAIGFAPIWLTYVEWGLFTQCQRALTHAAHHITLSF